MKNEWVEAIKAGKPEIAYSNFDIASLLTEAFLLGNVAIRTGKTLEWDGPGLRVTNAPRPTTSSRPSTAAAGKSQDSSLSRTAEIRQGPPGTPRPRRAFCLSAVCLGHAAHEC